MNNIRHGLMKATNQKLMILTNSFVQSNSDSMPYAKADLSKNTAQYIHFLLYFLAVLLFESHGRSIIRIKGYYANKYLTMNQNGVPAGEVRYFCQVFNPFFISFFHLSTLFTPI